MKYLKGKVVESLSFGLCVFENLGLGLGDGRSWVGAWGLGLELKQCLGQDWHLALVAYRKVQTPPGASVFLSFLRIASPAVQMHHHRRQQYQAKPRRALDSRTCEVFGLPADGFNCIQLSTTDSFDEMQRAEIVFKYYD